MVARLSLRKQGAFLQAGFFIYAAGGALLAGCCAGVIWPRCRNLHLPLLSPLAQNYRRLSKIQNSPYPLNIHTRLSNFLYQ